MVETKRGRPGSHRTRLLWTQTRSQWGYSAKSLRCQSGENYDGRKVL